MRKGFAKYMGLCWLLGLAFLMGCPKHPTVITSNQGKESTTVTPTNQADMRTATQIVVEGKNKGSIKLLAVKESRVNGFLQLQIGFQNVSKNDEAIQFEVLYFDSGGYPIKEMTPWTPLTIPAKGVRYASVIALRKEATTYNIHMIYS
jgi:hypothetical protein